MDNYRAIPTQPTPISKKAELVKRTLDGDEDAKKELGKLGWTIDLEDER